MLSGLSVGYMKEKEAKDMHRQGHFGNRMIRRGKGTPPRPPPRKTGGNRDLPSKEEVEYAMKDMWKDLDTVQDAADNMSRQVLQRIEINEIASRVSIEQFALPDGDTEGTQSRWNRSFRGQSLDPQTVMFFVMVCVVKWCSRRRLETVLHVRVSNDSLETMRDKGAGIW